MCPFDLAHVDSPKGDLDASGSSLSGPESVVIANDFIYPYGTTEQFPATKDSRGNVQKNSAHYYAECSNKGLCDRSTGACTCFEGYEGSACQRASCPSNANGMCSGHGTCKTAEEIAAADYGNIYNLWDATASLGCVCDPGYSGADCSFRSCKYGSDPLYATDYATKRYANFTVQLYTRSSSASIYGNYSLVFYDSFGKDWHTTAIAHDADCDSITNILEALPNNVIPSNSVLCHVDTNTDSEVTVTGVYVKTRYIIAFPSNPGRLEQPDINIYLDGSRATLYTDESSGSTLGYNIYPNGFTGEFTDYVNNLCEGVLVTLTTGTYYDTLATLSTAQTKLLKSCLGDADGDSSSNKEVYNWDYGSASNPHLLKLVDATQYSYNSTALTRDPSLETYPVSTLCSSETSYLSSRGSGYCYRPDPPGFYVVLYFDSDTAVFRVLNRPSQDYSSSTTFHVFTTTGYLTKVNTGSRTFSHFYSMSTSQNAAHAHSTTLYVANITNSYSGFKGQLDCETAPTGTYGSSECLDKDDYVVVINDDVTYATSHASNPIYVNLYQVKKIFRADRNYASDPDDTVNEYPRHQIVLDYGLNAKYTWAGYQATGVQDTSAALYKFTLPSDGYEYNAQCSNRGLCDFSTGLCQCFSGHTDDDCGTQNALAQ